MKKMMAFVAALSMASTLMAASAQFPYQAVLKDATGAALTGNKTVEIYLYNVPTGGSKLWGRSYSVLLDNTGLFNIEVSDSKGTAIGSSSKTLDAVFAENQDIYISLKVSSSSGEIMPRQKLLPVPFAAVASNVSSASGNFTVTGTLTAKSATVAQGLTANTMTVKGAASAGSVTSTGNATVSGNLTVSGTISGFGIAPVGTIIMWSQATIPNGWSLCNGQTVNGIKTPDLRGRFIVGAGSGSGYNVGDIGGAASVALTADQMPKHRHTYSFTGADLAGAYKKDNFFYNQGGKYSSLTNTKYTDYVGGPSNGAEGSAQAHENRPPYYAIYFIMRTN